VVACLYDARENVAHFGLVIDQSQQRFSACPQLADAEDIFGCGIQADDQEVVVKQYDARA